MIRTATRRAVTRRHVATRRKASPTRRRNGKKSNDTRRKQAVKAVVGLLGSGLTVAGILAIAHKYKKSKTLKKASKASTSASSTASTRASSTASTRASSTASTRASSPPQPLLYTDLINQTDFEVMTGCKIIAKDKNDPNSRERFTLEAGEKFRLTQHNVTRARIRRDRDKTHGWVDNNDILNNSQKHE